jgi:hypothetical protein
MRCRTAFGGAGGLGVPGPGTGNCLEGAAFAPCGHRLSPQAGGPAAVRRSLPRRPKPSRNFIPAGDAGRRAAAHPRLAGTCPNGAPSLFRSPPPSCRPLAPLAGGRGGRAGAFLRPPTPPPAHPRGFRGGSPGEATRIRPPRPDGRLDPGRPAVDSLALRGIPLGNGKDDPGSAGEFPGNTQAENARVGSRTKRPRAKRDPLGSGSQRHRSKPSGSLARLPCPPTFAPASTTANTTARRGFCPRPFTAPHAAGFGARFPDPGPGGDASHGAARRSPGAPALPLPSPPGLSGSESRY